MAQDIGGIQRKITREMRTADGTLDQDDLVYRVSSKGFSEPDVLEAVRIMMERGKISYDIEWHLRLEE